MSRARVLDTCLISAGLFCILTAAITLAIQSLIGH
jgi:hypothetical protein